MSTHRSNQCGRGSTSATNLRRDLQPLAGWLTESFLTSWVKRPQSPWSTYESDQAAGVPDEHDAAVLNELDLEAESDDLSDAAPGFERRESP